MLIYDPIFTYVWIYRDELKLFIHFYRALLKMFQEIHYWERLIFEIPHYAADVYAKREDLRNLREHVLLVVRDYNRSV